MYIVEVSPLKNIKAFPYLSYFSSHKFKKFDIIKVPFRQSEILAVVSNVKEVKSIKADIKNKDFAPRKIRKQEPMDFISKDFIKAAFDLAKFSVRAPGLILEQALPKSALKYYDKINPPPKNSKKEDLSDEKINTLLINDFSAGRLESFKALVRQKLAQGESVLLVCPNRKTAKNIYDFLAPGISSLLYFYDSGLSPLKQIKEINEIRASDKARCIVGTPAILFSDAKNLGLIIIEKEASISYKRQRHPKSDIVKLAELLAKRKNIEIAYADSFLRLENYMQLFKEEAHVLGHIPKRLRKRTRLRIIDLGKEIQYNKEYKLSYPIISKEILGQIERNLKENKKVFIFNPKKGFSSQIVCNDCAHVLSCPKCKARLRLQEDPRSKERHIVCMRCGYALHSNITCPKCNSWRLLDLGIGIDKVADFLKQKFANLEIFILDKDKVKSEKEAEQIITAYYEKDTASILLGTQKALDYIPSDSVDYSTALSVDSLLSVPDFKIEEKIFSTLTEILDKTKEAFDIQVKDPKTRVIELFASKDLHKFTKSELKLREKLMWPPYVQLISVSISGNRKAVIEKMQKLIDIFADYKPRVFRDFIYLDKNTVELKALFRVPSDIWPDASKDFYKKLKELPAEFKIELNPEQVF